MHTYKALMIHEQPDGRFTRSIETSDLDTLPHGDVLIRVYYTSLNYKDVLSVTGNKGITKQYPHTPGIDAAGIVVESLDLRFKAGDEVIVTGYDLGMNTSGGFSTHIRVPSNWVIAKPDALTLKECMIIGTAGLTAATALYKMEQLGVNAHEGMVAVTGATGGVGSWAIVLLHAKGYRTIAITGKPDRATYLKKLGADIIESREFANDNSGKLLIRPRWAGAIDTVGGNTLTTLLKACASEGVVATTGLVTSNKLDTSLFPFILNGISLVGVASAEMPLDFKKKLWHQFADDHSLKDAMHFMCHEVDLNTLMHETIDAMLHGKTWGRTVVNLALL